MSDETEKTRTAWAATATRLAEKMLERKAKVDDLRQNLPLGMADKQETLREICSLGKDIAGIADELDDLEKGAPVGATALCGRNPGVVPRMALALMAAARWDQNVSRETHEVQDVTLLVSAVDSESCLQTRALFRDDSPLRPHILIAYATTLDESGVRLKEGSLNRLLGQKPDGADKMTEAVGLSGKWR